MSAADATEADYLAAIERSLSTGDGLKTTSEQAECMAPKWLDTIGIDRLREHDVAPSDIGDDVNDEPVFERNEPSWLTVRIGHDIVGSKARWFLHGPAELPTMLDRMLVLGGGQAGGGAAGSAAAGPA